MTCHLFLVLAHEKRTATLITPNYLKINWCTFVKMTEIVLLRHVKQEIN